MEYCQFKTSVKQNATVYMNTCDNSVITVEGYPVSIYLGTMITLAFVILIIVTVIESIIEKIWKQ